MARVTQASIGAISIVASSAIDVSAVTKGTTNLQSQVSTVEWSEEGTLNAADFAGAGLRQFTDGKKTATLVINGYPDEDPTMGFDGATRVSGGGNNILGQYAIYMEYGGAMSNARIMKAIAKLLTKREAVDAEGAVVIETTWQSVGDELPTVTS